MYAYLRGRIASKGQNELVIDVGGVGYRVLCSMTTLAEAPAAGEEMTVYTWLSVKEDAMELFGFAAPEEKQMFLSLTGISGIGPRSALQILGSMPLRDLTLAIVTGDIAALSRAPGVGKKTAQRIALELKGKVTEEELTCVSSGGASAPVNLGSDAVAEAIEALQALGYTSSEAAKAVSKVQNESGKADDLIRLALRSMAGM